VAGALEGAVESGVAAGGTAGMLTGMAVGPGCGVDGGEATAGIGYSEFVIHLVALRRGWSFRHFGQRLENPLELARAFQHVMSRNSGVAINAIAHCKIPYQLVLGIIQSNLQILALEQFAVGVHDMLDGEEAGLRTRSGDYHYPASKLY